MAAFGLQIVIFILLLLKPCTLLPTTKDLVERGPRQIIHRNSDGSITASFAASNAFQGGGFDVAQTVNIGPNGATFTGGQSFSSDIGGNRMSFGQSNSQSSQFGPNGFSSTGSNAASNSFSNPLFQSSNAQANANAFSNQFPQNNNVIGFSK